MDDKETIIPGVRVVKVPGKFSPELLRRAAHAIAFTADEGCYPVGGFENIGYGLSTETPIFAQLVAEYGEQAAADIAELLGIEK